MIYRLLADALMLFHFAFISFVMVGGVLVLRWGWVKWLHLPAVGWGLFVEVTHRICPLTPWENQFRQWGGEAGYEGSFVDHYIMPIVYPRGLTDQMQIQIAILILTINCICYGLVAYRWYRSRAAVRATIVEDTTNGRTA